MLTLNLFCFAANFTYYFTVIESNPNLWVCAHRDSDYQPFRVFAIDASRIPQPGEMKRISDLSLLPTALRKALKDRLANQSINLAY